MQMETAVRSARSSEGSSRTNTLGVFEPSRKQAYKDINTTTQQGGVFVCFTVLQIETAVRSARSSEGSSRTNTLGVFEPSRKQVYKDINITTQLHGCS